MRCGARMGAGRDQCFGERLRGHRTGRQAPARGTGAVGSRRPRWRAAGCAQIARRNADPGLHDRRRRHHRGGVACQRPAAAGDRKGKRAVCAPCCCFTALTVARCHGAAGVNDAINCLGPEIGLQGGGFALPKRVWRASRSRRCGAGSRGSSAPPRSISCRSRFAPSPPTCAKRSVIKSRLSVSDPITRTLTIARWRFRSPCPAASTRGA